MRVQAEVSLYPISEGEPLPAILSFVEDLERAGLDIAPGAMSTLVAGECAAVFAALGEAFESSARAGRRALVVKVSAAKPSAH